MDGRDPKLSKAGSWPWKSLKSSQWRGTVSWVSSVQLLSHVWLSATPWTAACQASLSITNSQSLLKLMAIESVMPSNHPILCRPLRLPPSIFLSIRVFSNESVLHIRWPKYWSFNFSIIHSNEYSGLISFRIDWLDLLSPRDFQESSPTSQFKSINSLALSFLYNPTLKSTHDYWKTIALTKWTFAGKVMSLLFNILSSLVINFLPRSKHLLISRLQSPSVVILEPKKNSLSLFPHLFAMKSWDQMPWSSFSECWALSQLFHSPLPLSSRGFLVLRFMP